METNSCMGGWSNAPARDTGLEDFILSPRTTPDSRMKSVHVHAFLYINPDANVGNYWSSIIISKVQHYGLHVQITCKVFAANINKPFGKQNKAWLIWNGGLTANVQFPVAWVIAVALIWEGLDVLPEPAYKNKEVRGRWQHIFKLIYFK
jgi:hypothetical protein